MQRNLLVVGRADLHTDKDPFNRAQALKPGLGTGFTSPGCFFFSCSRSVWILLVERRLVGSWNSLEEETPSGHGRQGGGTGNTKSCSSEKRGCWGRVINICRERMLWKRSLLFVERRLSTVAVITMMSHLSSHPPRSILFSCYPPAAPSSLLCDMKTHQSPWQ